MASADVTNAIVAIEYEFDPREHLRAGQVLWSRSPARWVGRAFGVLAAGASIWAVYGNVSAGSSSLVTVINAMPWFLLACFWFGFGPIMLRRAVRQVVKNDPSVRGPQRKTVDAAGYHAAGNGVSLDLPWHAMLNVVETDEFWFFYYMKHLAHYIGKKRLSAVQISELRQLASNARPVE